ncbi:MAG: hypothetical protein EON98_09680 [Chitinophagaceae bacterium]|nr:MAG: hypothetical protein EON98_09680 [Chitinophagaceae bacterium]
MKKNVYAVSLTVFAFFFLISTQSLAQRRQVSVPQPGQFLQKIKKEIAKARFSATARTQSCSYDSLVFTRQSQIDSFPITNPGCTVLRELRIYGDGASPAITNLDSLYAITEITSFFEVDHTSLTDLSGLSGLQRTAWLWLGYNPLMTNVMPPNLTYAGSVLLNELPLFTSFNGFTQNLGSSRLGYLWIFNNVGINNFNGLCSFPPICEYLNRSNAAIIHDNDAGCSSIAEIKSNCGLCSVVDTRTWTGSTNDEWTEPTNWSPAGIPASCDSVIIPAGAFQRPKLMANTVIHALTMEYGTELFFNGNGLAINGDVNADGVQMGGGIYLNINNAQDVNISNSSVYVDNVSIDNYKGNLNIAYNSFQGNLSLFDHPDRTGGNNLDGNTIRGNLSITANATDGGASTYISENSDDQVYGITTFKVNTPVYFSVGGNSIFHAGGNLEVKSDDPNYPFLYQIDFNGGVASARAGNRQQLFDFSAHITQLGTEPITIYKGSINKASHSDKVVLDQDVYISDDFRFGVGLVKTEATKLLIFRHGAKISQTSSASWVWGPIKKIGTSPFGTFKFPVGTDIYQGAVEISNPQQATDEFTAQYFYENPTAAGFDTAQKDPSLTRVSGIEYWKIDRNAGTSSVYEFNPSCSIQSRYAGFFRQYIPA